MEVDDQPEGPWIEPQQRRAHPRYGVREPAELLFVNHGLPLTGHILDISVEGCRIETAERCPPGTGLRVEVCFKANGLAFRFLGVIQWNDGQHMVGIRFVEISQRRKDELAEVILEMEAAAQARAAKDAAERAEAARLAEQLAREAAEREAKEQAEREAEELAGREALERAEKDALEWEAIQELVGQARAAALENSTAHSPETPGGDTISPRNRRGQARHAVDTSAAIYLVKIGSRLEGRIQDLSLSGCRIRTVEKFPVGIYTRVEAGFHLNGMPFRLGGVIQAIHDSHNVGVRFLDLSERNRQRVAELIAEIDELRKAEE